MNSFSGNSFSTFMDNTTSSSLGLCLLYQRGRKQMVSLTPTGIRGYRLCIYFSSYWFYSDPYSKYTIYDGILKLNNQTKLYVFLSQPSFPRMYLVYELQTLRTL